MKLDYLVNLRVYTQFVIERTQWIIIVLFHRDGRAFDYLSPYYDEEPSARDVAHEVLQCLKQMERYEEEKDSAQV